MRAGSATRGGGLHAVAADLALVGLIVMIVIMLITPLSPEIIDILVFFSLTLSIMTLMITIYVENAIAFSSYPVVLLILAIWRISLSVATTRNILVDGDAGTIITAFGQVAIAGNLVVGVVIFFLITIVQFIVINKGSERVAEVGARFTLDSLPGKQMSIDADLRSGSIDATQARHLRGELQAESQMHGAMDGAMKFLKGDAIAGLLMVFVNFLGGLAIGSMQGGLGFAEVVQKYTILSIGDALIGQIPAIFTAVSAGILVTRVSREQEEGVAKPTLSQEVVSQFLGYPRALAASGLVVVVIAMIPGFPMLLCLCFAAACGAGWFLVERARSRLHRGYEHGRPGGDAPARIHLLLSARVGAAISIPEAEIRLRREVIQIAREAGLPCPACEVHVDEAVFDDLFIVAIDDTPLAGGGLNAGAHYALNCASILGVCGIRPDWVETERPGMTYFHVRPEDAPLITAFGAVVLDPLDYMIERVSADLRLSVCRLIDVDQVRRQLLQLARTSPEVHRELAKLMQPAALADLLRKLAAEQVPIHNVDQVFEKVLLAMQRDKDPHSVHRNLRRALADQITFKWLCTDGGLYTIQLDDALCDELGERIIATSDGETIDIALALAQELAASIADALQRWELEVGKLVLLVPQTIRSGLFHLLAMSFPGLPVIAFEELRRDADVRPFHVVSLAGSPALLAAD